VTHGHILAFKEHLCIIYRRALAAIVLKYSVGTDQKENTWQTVSARLREVEY